MSEKRPSDSMLLSIGDSYGLKRSCIPYDIMSKRRATKIWMYGSEEETVIAVTVNLRSITNDSQETTGPRSVW